MILLILYIWSIWGSLGTVRAALPAELVGTWTSKANETMTGPGFYNAHNDTFTEPLRTGISYSFSSEGFYEEALFRAISNPTNPQCPSGILQFQHGSWIQNANGSLTLTPIAVDGRQLLSTPCSSSHAVYTRYNQSEMFKTYQVYTDLYTKLTRLDLFQFDGTPVNPLFKAADVPVMVATTTLNPTESGSVTAAASTGTARGTASTKRKRDESDSVRSQAMLRENVKRMKWDVWDPDMWWWTGSVFTAVGGVLYFGPKMVGL